MAPKPSAAWDERTGLASAPAAGWPLDAPTGFPFSRVRNADGANRSGRLHGFGPLFAAKNDGSEGCQICWTARPADRRRRRLVRPGPSDRCSPPPEYSAYIHEHQRRFHVGRVVLPQLSHASSPSAIGTARPSRTERETRCRFVQCSFDKLHRLRITGTYTGSKACLFELTDHVIGSGFVTFRSDVAAFQLVVGQELNVCPPGFSRRIQSVSAAAAAPIRISVSPIFDRIIQFSLR